MMIFRPSTRAGVFSLGQSAYIRFVENSGVESLTLDDLKEQLQIYREQMSRTASQLGWDYEDAAFPYTVEMRPEGEGKWFYLKGKNEKYRHIVFGVGQQTVTSDEGEEKTVHYVQVALPDGSTHGDKAKANELCKFLASRLKAELQMFNGRVIHYNYK